MPRNETKEYNAIQESISFSRCFIIYFFPRKSTTACCHKGWENVIPITNASSSFVYTIDVIIFRF